MKLRKSRRRSRRTGCKGQGRKKCGKLTQCKMTRAGKRRSHCKSKTRAKRRLPKRSGGGRRRRRSRRSRRRSRRSRRRRQSRSWNSWF